MANEPETWVKLEGSKDARPWVSWRPLKILGLLLIGWVGLVLALASSTETIRLAAYLVYFVMSGFVFARALKRAGQESLGG